MTETIVLAGGCFWCTEAVFVNVRGVQDVESGYSNGHTVQPTYEQVCTGGTGHAEVIRVAFDPDIVALRVLLDIFFTVHDPTTPNRQGHDVGTQYRSGIYWTDPAQVPVIESTLREWTEQGVFDAPLVTEVQALANYWPAEPYHQDFFARNPGQPYCVAVAAPKVRKLRQQFAQWLK